jgi:hypothetical protein
MQGVSRSLGRIAAVLAVSSLLVTQSAFASARQDDRGGLLDRLTRLKHVVVKILSDIGVPKG